MSRDDPQFKLRMPQGLRLIAEQAAKAAGRSLNSELIARLESSFLNESSEKLLTAERARELASLARKGIPGQIRERIINAINKSVSLGHSSASVDFGDLNLEGNVSDDEFEQLTTDVNNELKNSGYSYEWDGCSHLWITF